MIARVMRLCAHRATSRKFIIGIVLFGLNTPENLSARTAAARSPHTFLASIVGIPLAKNEALQSFQIDTWDVRFKAVCHLPLGWRITAGGGATPDGTLAGEGGQGLVFLNTTNIAELHNIALITLDGPVLKTEIRSPGSVRPITFSGRARLITYGSDRTRSVKLTSANIRLIKGVRCPG